MAISWVLVETETATTGDFSLTRNTYVAAYGAGYMLRVDRVFENTAFNFKIDAESSLCYVLGSVPQDITWTLEDTAVESDIIGLNTITNTTRTYTGRPKDGNGLPIGADQFFMLEKELSQTAGQTPLIRSVIAITPVTLDQIFYGA